MRGGQEPEKRGDSAPFDVCNQSREETSQPEERRSQGKQKMRLGGLDEGACSRQSREQMSGLDAVGNREPGRVQTTGPA